jgi:hypothetical protein
VEIKLTAYSTKNCGAAHLHLRLYEGRGPGGGPTVELRFGESFDKSPAMVVPIRELQKALDAVCPEKP